MEIKDYLALFISSLALIVSWFSLKNTRNQKNKEIENSKRVSLTNTISEISKINIETTKLNCNSEISSAALIELRRNYNAQRRYLTAHAEFLMEEIEHLISDIDCNIMAVAFNLIGEYSKANHYWEKCINVTESDVIKSMNLRGYASFLFYQGAPQLGRKKYQESLEIQLPDTDNIRRHTTDTLLLWAQTESDFQYWDEASRIIRQARAHCQRIGHLGMRKEMLERIEPFEARVSENQTLQLIRDAQSSS